MRTSQGYPAVGFECPMCGCYQYTEQHGRNECESCNVAVNVSKPVSSELATLWRKVAHGCTDATCPECDR